MISLDASKKTLQKSDMMDLTVTIALIQSLKRYVDALKNNSFEKYERRATTLTHNGKY